MSLQTLLLAALVVGYGAAQYALMFHAMRDLLNRPRVRGGNKALWGLAILCIPIAGALIYGWMGPTSFLRRPTRATSLAPALPRIASDRPAGAASRKVTPIRPGIATRRRPPHYGVGRQGSAERPVNEPRRTGS
jgi:hypothetical protein